jgi:lysophospholipase L1-like esterase
MGVDVRTNSDGLRDRDFGATPQPGVTRIMMLGDSLTFGWGVPEEKTYSKRLEGMLARAGHRVEVINTGVGNYNTSMEVEYFLDRGVKYRPDIVVLNYFINDAEPMPRYDTTYFSRNLRAYVYFASRLDAALRQTDSGKRGWQEYYAALYDPALNGSGLASVRTAVKRLATYCQRNGIRLVLANYPELRVMKPYPFPYVDDFVRGLAAENSIPLIELLPEVEQADPETLWVTRPDPHPSVAAHEAFSQGLFAYFKGLFRVAGSK